MVWYVSKEIFSKKSPLPKPALLTRIFREIPSDSMYSLMVRAAVSFVQSTGNLITGTLKVAISSADVSSKNELSSAARKIP
jgi:hypothetical protein